MPNLPPLVSAGKIFARRFRCASAVLSLAAVLVMTAEQAALADSITPLPNATINFGTVSIPRDTPVGTYFTRALVNSSYGTTTGVTCAVTKTPTISGTLVPGFTDLYQTGVPGVGVRMLYTASWTGGWIATPATETLPKSGVTGWGFYRQAQLHIYAQPSSGTTQAADFPTLTLTYSGSCLSPNPVVSTLSLTGTFIVATLSCTVTTPTIDVALPKISTSALPADGSTAGATPVSIGLNCANIGSAKVYVTLTDQTTPSNTSNLLSLTPSSTAKGVQLQILNAGTPVSYGPDSSAVGNTNQILLAASGGLTKVNLTAQYVRTGALTPGTIGSVATFTMSYQ